MKRTSLTDETNRWFDIEAATEYNEGTYWNGRNQVSLGTRSQFEHETLYKTAGGKWIYHTWSNYQGTPSTYVEIDETEAVEFFIRNEYQDEDIPSDLISRMSEYEC
jgi:hypothetical protein